MDNAHLVAEQAVHPLLLDRGLEDISFVPTPYPTNICQVLLLQGGLSKG